MSLGREQDDSGGTDGTNRMVHDFAFSYGEPFVGKTVASS